MNEERTGKCLRQVEHILNQKWTIQRNWQHRVHKTKKNPKQKHNTTRVGHHSTQANTNNINNTDKTSALLQTTRGKDEPNMVFMRTSQHGTQNVKTHNKTTQKAKKMSNTDPTK